MTNEEKMSRAKANKAKVESQIRRLAKSLKDDDRRLDARRINILGSELLRVAKEDVGGTKIIDALIAGLVRQSDVDAFKDFVAPTPPAAAKT